MLKRDNIFIGIALALIFPAAAFVVAYLLRENIYIINKPALPYLVAIALNLVSARLFASRGMVKTVRGIITTSFVLVMVLFIFKFHLHT